MREYVKRIVPFKRLYDNIIASCKDHKGKDSATRINGYLTMILIYLVVIVFVTIELINTYKAFITPNQTYTISVQLITILGFLLSHQLILFNIKRKKED